MSLFDEVVAEYVSPYAPRGQANKCGYLRRFAGWCAAQDIDPLEPSRINLDRYRGFLVAEGGMPRSINSHLTTLRSWGAWMEREGYWATNRAQYLKRLPAPNQVTLTWLSDAQVAVLLDHVDQAADPVMRGLIYVLAYFGVRPQEARMLDECDVDLDADTLRLRDRKDGRTSIFALPDPVRGALAPLLTGHKTAPLFVNEHTGERISKGVATKRFNRLVRDAVIPKITMYGLRASFATNSLAAGISPRDVQDAMGHSTADMTARYDQARRARASVAQLAAAERLDELKLAA